MAFLGKYYNAYLMVNSVNLSTFLKSNTFPLSNEALDSTTMGKSNKTYLAGLGDAQFTAEFVADFGASGVHQTLVGLRGAAPFACKWRPDAGAIATTNPEAQFNAILTAYEPVSGGSVGQLAMSSATFQITDDITWDTTP